MKFKPSVEPLEDRTNPTKLVIALEYTAGVIEDNQAIKIGEMVKRNYSPEGKVDVVITDPPLSSRLIRRTKKTNTRVIVASLSPSQGDGNKWGDSTGDNYAIAYLGSIRLATPDRLLFEIAATVTHEVGHCLGLGHPMIPDPTNWMNAGVISANATFPNKLVWLTDYGVQNPHYTIWKVLNKPKSLNPNLLY